MVSGISHPVRQSVEGNKALELLAGTPKEHGLQEWQPPDTPER